MPKHRAPDLITDREMAFARLVHSGTMTDHEAAESAGLNLDTAAYIKSKPCVRAYLLGLSAAAEEHLGRQEAEGPGRQIISREQVLNRLWEIASMSPEITRNSVAGQVKAISIIVAIEGLIPDRKDKPSPPPSPKANIFRAPWLPKRPGEAEADQASPDFAAHEEETANSDHSPAAADTPSAPEPPHSPAPNPSSGFSEFTPAHSLTPARTNPWVPEASGFAYTPDQNVALPKDRFGRQNRYGRGR
jgi:hypothetical protein